MTTTTINWTDIKQIRLQRFCGFNVEYKDLDGIQYKFVNNITLKIDPNCTGTRFIDIINAKTIDDTFVKIYGDDKHIRDFKRIGDVDYDLNILAIFNENPEYPASNKFLVNIIEQNIENPAISSPFCSKVVLEAITINETDDSIIIIV